MAYQTQTFTDNETVLTAAMMDHIEAGIVANETSIEDVSTDLASHYVQKNAIATSFDETTPYTEGQYVWHENVLCRFLVDHEPGAFVDEEVEYVPEDGLSGEIATAVRYDAAQGLTVEQKTQACGNIGAQSRVEPDDSVQLELNDSESAYITGDVGQQIQYHTATASMVFKHVAFVQGGCDYVLSMSSGQLSSYNARTQAIVDDSDVIIQQFNVTVVENGTTETRFTAEADGILCVCVDTSTDDIQLHGGPLYGTVRYNTDQGLTDVQMAQARENVGAVGTDEMSAAINAVAGARIGMWETGFYRTETEGNPIAHNSNDNYMSCYLPVTPGETVQINAAGSSGLYRLYVFIDEDGNSLGFSSTGLSGVRTVTVPANAVAIAVNNRLSDMDSGYYAYVGTTLINNVSGLDERINALNGFINYHYDTSWRVIGTYSSGNVEYTINRAGTSVTIESLTSDKNSTSIKWYLNDEYKFFGSTGVAHSLMKLVDGHTYRAYLHYVSGTITDGGVVRCAWYKSNVTGMSGLVYSSGLPDGDCYSDLTYTDEDFPNGIGIALFVGRNVEGGISISNYKVVITVEDITNAGDKNLAPIDAPIAKDTHQPGELLTVGGQLYKATQAITPGTVITSGTNVAETTVAEELASRDLQGGSNLFAPLCNVHGSITTSGRTIEIDGCRFKKERISSDGSSNTICVSLLGDAFHYWNAGTSVSDATVIGQGLQDSDFVPAPIWMLDLNAYILHIVTSWRSTTNLATNGRVMFFTKDANGVITPSNVLVISNKDPDYKISLSFFVTQEFGYAVMNNGNLAFVYSNSNSHTGTDQEFCFSIENALADMSYLAPMESVTAGENHVVGDLISYGNRLYRVTDPIAAGETISGANTEYTSVAKELYTRDTAIAGRAKSGAIAGSLPSNPSLGDLVMDSTGDLFVVSEVDTPNVGEVMLTPTTVAEQLADVKTSIVNDTFVEPWQMMCKKYFITAGSSWLSVSGNRLVYNPTSSTANVSVKVIVGELASRSSNVSGYTPLISELIPVSVFGDAIKMGFYSSSDTSGRYPRLCYKFCTVSGGTVTPVSGAYGLVPDEAANNALAEKTVPVPEGATHVFFGVYFSGIYAGTYDMVYKVDKG